MCSCYLTRKKLRSSKTTFKLTSCLIEHVLQKQAIRKSDGYTDLEMFWLKKKQAWLKILIKNVRFRGASHCSAGEAFDRVACYEG